MKLIPLPGSDLELARVVSALEKSGERCLEVLHPSSDRPSGHFQDPLVQIKGRKEEEPPK